MNSKLFFSIFTIAILLSLSFNGGKNSSLNPIPTDDFIAPNDVSGMFNERGFSKSNSVSVDENELINDFNGNLNYSIPLYKYKGPGDISLSIDLNYNGSMSYQVFAATVAQTSGISVLPKYNINAPGWIFSVNGMGVQMLNFETNFFTYPLVNNSDSVSNENCRLLSSGYHITDRLMTSQTNSNSVDEFFILKGDGTVITLKKIITSNTNCGGFDPECYSGEYYSDDKGDYTRAFVEFIENGYMPYYRNRRVFVMQGDGLTYIYEEQKNSYSDYNPNSSGSEIFKPQVLLLKKIKDRFGNNIDLSYINYITAGGYSQMPIYGRPLLKTVGGNWTGSTLHLIIILILLNWNLQFILAAAWADIKFIQKVFLLKIHIIIARWLQK